MEFLARHLTLAAVCAAAAMSSAGVFVARAVRSPTRARRMGWTVLALLEAGISAGIVTEAIRHRSRGSPEHKVEVREGAP
jgi:hypothetical protein